MTEVEPEHEQDGTAGSGPFLQWLKAAGTRAIKTAAQAAIAAIPTTAATIGGVDWRIVAGTAALAALMSLLTSIAGVPEVQDGTSLPQLK
ncbi:holin [Bifidobacterium sp. ESL0745]|uniref:holin n=1 Tax=Bifidobacterium sp. ESL0745 TaxID=2983226 RepID=UPI0023F7EC74|nr:holin [Bifidobacterium sp. ESL0745]MDF7665747.1 holin [Bifidobacterium sp. ESL0745]